MPTQTYPPGTVLMRPMLDGLARNWWLILLRGICAIIFGVLTFVWPGLTLVTLILLYGVFALFDGGLAIGAAEVSPENGYRQPIPVQILVQILFAFRAIFDGRLQDVWQRRPLLRAHRGAYS